MSTLSNQEVTAFVGKRADYYLQKWRHALDGAGSAGNATGFNWAAFFLSGLWLSYRKMYRATVIFFGIILLEMFFGVIVYVGFWEKLKAPASLGIVASLIAAMVCGGFGNAWYLSHTQKAVAKVRSQGLTEDAYLQALAKRGGTSLPAALGFMVLFVLAAMFIISLGMSKI